MIPEHTKRAIDRWVEHGTPPGSFVTAVLENDLKGAIGRADDINSHFIKEIVQYCWWEIPSSCWGSPPKMCAWARSLQVKEEEKGGVVNG